MPQPYNRRKENCASFPPRLTGPPFGPGGSVLASGRLLPLAVIQFGLVLEGNLPGVFVAIKQVMQASEQGRVSGIVGLEDVGDREGAPAQALPVQRLLKREGYSVIKATEESGQVHPAAWLVPAQGFRPARTVFQN